MRQAVKEHLLLSYRRPLSSAASLDSIYDVAIIGGGMVGSALACALGRSPVTEELRVLVVDKVPLPEISAPGADPPELRVSTLTPASVRLFEESGAWDSMAPPRSAAFRHMQVWDHGGNGCVRYSAATVGLPVMGYVAENRVIQAALGQTLRSRRSVVDYVSPASLQTLTLPAYAPDLHSGMQSNELAEIGLDSGQTVRARLVVGADGSRSRVRELADLRTFSWSYHQRGIVATVRTQHPNDTAWQRFLRTGPLALLPVRGSYSNVVWSTSVAEAGRLQALTPQAFALEVNQALQGGCMPARNPLLPGASSDSFIPPPTVYAADGAASQQSFPLALLGSGRYVRPRLALVGDAAHVVHPLAGQGVNLGFADVGQLAAALAHAVETGRDIGDLGLLQEMYEAPRQSENARMMTALDSLKRVFAPQDGLLASLRGLGLDLLNGSGVIKRQIMRYAMGVA
ncbi:hypothetical protein CVIRNUC_002857 [Coccomyxa viridis]|uniref:Ubiquinone biosynthesis monooxygenase COQ6, mitochondrial n=1 Tax=Coccomyxa viridis TaxID=1274662 RepID=A0AAV1I1E2_9CHLO|nr:hypothetical protein CVIRNUC_002857 [Coccomyxa viridis]